MDVFLQGHIAALAALSARKRDFNALYVKHGAPSRDALRVLARAQAQDIPVIRAAREELDALCGGVSHGGILLKCGVRRWDPPDALYTTGASLFFCVEGIEDPYNLGAAIRSVYAAGADALLVSERDWGFADPLIARASAGTYDALPILPLSEDVIEGLRASGTRIVLADAAPSAVPLFDADLTGRVLIAIGGERRGVSRFIRERAGTLVRIPYGRLFEHALPTATATSIMAFEALRQRR